MKQSSLVCLLVVMLSLGGSLHVFAAEESIHPDSGNWQLLFNEDLSNAVYEKGVWSVQDGELTATEDKSIWTNRDYENFILDLEFKNAHETNSGVIVYCSDLKEWIPNSIEIQIADDYAEKWAESPKTWQCGAVFGHLPATKQVVKKAGEWNRMTIQCQGKSLKVTLNNEAIIDMNLDDYTSATENPDGSEVPPWLSKAKSTLPTFGRIGFQGKHGNAPVWFKNIRIKELNK